MASFSAGAKAAPLDFNALQTRISRKAISDSVLSDFPVRFLAYDCLEFAGEDLRPPNPSKNRLQILGNVLGGLPPGNRIHRSAPLAADNWADLTARWGESRSRGVEGLMLKRRDSPYRVGRVKGDWWKWKVDPFTADLVMIYAQAGHGRRAGLYTDYTFAAREGDRFLSRRPGLQRPSRTKKSARLDRWIKEHTLAKRGPVRTVPPQWVFEIAFEGIRASNRHKSGLALRFSPRIPPLGERTNLPLKPTPLSGLRGLLPATASPAPP